MALKREHSESVLAESVVTWLESEGWTVYQEVRAFRDHGACCDIVAVRDQLAWAIECKMNLTLALLAQARHWIHLSSYVSIAVPARTHYRDQSEADRLGKALCKQWGVGVIEVGDHGVNVAEHAVLHRSGYKSHWLNVVCDEHRTHARAGSAEGGMWTPFRGTREKIEAYVRDNPGVALRDLVKAVPHHYASAASARAQIEKLCRKGVFKGMELKRHGGHAYLYPRNSEVEAA